MSPTLLAKGSRYDTLLDNQLELGLGYNLGIPWLWILAVASIPVVFPKAASPVGGTYGSLSTVGQSNQFFCILDSDKTPNEQPEHVAHSRMIL
jgi:hypothetical protein